MARYGVLPDLLRQWTASGVDRVSCEPLLRSAGGYLARLAEHTAARLRSSAEVRRLAT